MTAVDDHRNELHGISGGFLFVFCLIMLSQDTLLLLFVFCFSFSFSTLRTLCIYYGFQFSDFTGIFTACVNNVNMFLVFSSAFSCLLCPILIWL